MRGNGKDNLDSVSNRELRNSGKTQIEKLLKQGTEESGYKTREESLQEDSGEVIKRKLDNTSIISRVIDLKIHEKFELDGKLYETKKEAIQALAMLEGRFDDRLFKVEFHNKVGISKEKIERYYHIDVEPSEFSVLVDSLSEELTHYNLLQMYLEYYVGKPIVKDNISGKYFTNYVIVPGNLKEAQHKNLSIISKKMMRHMLRYTD